MTLKLAPTARTNTKVEVAPRQLTEVDSGNRYQFRAVVLELGKSYTNRMRIRVRSEGIGSHPWEIEAGQWLTVNHKYIPEGLKVGDTIRFVATYDTQYTNDQSSKDCGRILDRPTNLEIAEK